MWQPGQSPVPGYKLEKFIGKGNFGEVWQSSSPGGTKCALKFLNLRERQGRKELRAIQRLKQIRHANIMPLNAMWLLDDRQQIIPDDQFEPSHPFMEDTSRQTLMSPLQVPEEEKPRTLVIAMPLAEGNLLELLYSRQKQGQDIPVEELLVYMMDAARALDYLNTQRHEYNGQIVSVQHGDVKPENLVLLGGSVMLCDFGVARTLGGGADTRGTSLGGSLAYMAPECMAGEISQHSDQFSLAIGYAELRTGHLPFPDESMTQVIEDRRKGQLDLDGLTPDEQRVIRRACSVHPDKRFESNVEFVQALRSAVLDTTPKSRQFNWLVPASFAFVLVCAGVLGWMIRPPKLTQDRDPPPLPTPTKPGTEIYAEVMSILNESQVSAARLQEAKEKYLAALDADFPLEIPEPARQLGVPDNANSGVYSRADFLNLQLVDVHPQSGRILVGSQNGLSLVEPGINAKDDRTYDFEFTSPIASVRWLDDNHVLVRDRDLVVWRIDLRSLKKVQIATNVLRTVTSPLGAVGLVASDNNGGIIYCVEAEGLHQATHKMVTPLLAIDEKGIWGVTLEEYEPRGTAKLLAVVTPSPGVALKIVGEIDTKIEPYCVACLLMGQNCFAVVGGKPVAPPGGGIAVIPFPGDAPSSRSSQPEVIFPTSPIDKDLFQKNGRSVRSLATFFSAERSVGLLATGQDSSTESPMTELWEVRAEGSVSHQGLVGQETQGTSISALAFDPTGQWLVRGTSNGEVRLTKLSAPRSDFELLSENYQEEVLQLHFTDGKIVATFRDASVLIWNFYECQMVYDACQIKQQKFPKPKFVRSQSG